MESIKTQVSTVGTSGFYERIVLSALNRFSIGHLTLVLPNGNVLKLGDRKGLNPTLHIHNDAFFKKVVLSGDIGMGESYCDGDWTTDDLTTLICWAIQNVETSGFISGSKVKDWSVNLLGKFNKLVHLKNRNSKTGSQSNISYHYDLSNDFYQLMLDETMMYSCAMFEDESVDLKNGQLKKLQTICDDLEIKDGDHILEIGCGWGGFAAYAATKYNCKITGITISKEQYKYAQERIKRLKLEDRVTLLLKDYRDLEGEFDKIVSIEMIEAVGHEFLPGYFAVIDKLLKKDGVAVIQAITSPDSRYESFRKGVDFIQKHIFPGSLLPSVRSMVNACEETQLHLFQLRDIGLDYARTLREWDKRVEQHKKKILELGMDDVFFRKWKYYLCYCEAAFLERNISDVHLTFIKPNNTSFKVKGQ